MPLKPPVPINNARVTVMGLNSTGPIEALAVVQLDSTGGIGSPGAGSTQVSVKEILTSSGASVMDSTEGAIKVNVVAGAAGGSTYVSVRQSTAADLNSAVVQGSTVWAGQSRALPAQAFTYGQVTLNTTAVLIAAANANRTRLLVTQISGVAAYLGASTVTSGSGHLLSSAVGYPVVFRHDDAVYGITAASTTIVSFVEETL